PVETIAIIKREPMQLVGTRIAIAHAGPDEHRLPVSNDHRSEPGPVPRDEDLITGRIVPDQPLRFGQMPGQYHSRVPPNSGENRFVLREHKVVRYRHNVAGVVSRRAYLL